MEVILKKDVNGVGYKNDLITVKDGFGRNYLIPKGLATIASESSKKALTELKKQQAYKEDKIVKEAEAIAESSFKSLRSEQLTFSRWVQVIYRFEKKMYANPDQDLNLLWWQLVEKYQLLKKPEGRDEPDWASKIHIALYPAYYHNYMLGELLASQLHNYITTKVLKVGINTSDCFVGESEVGDYLKHLPYFSFQPHFLQVADTQPKIIEKNSVTREIRAKKLTFGNKTPWLCVSV